MKLNELIQVPGTEQEAKRKGQGIGSGNGKTAGRGTKGQRARAGGYHRVGFEGGQMPLHMRLPKRGFKNSRFKKVYSLVNVGDLERFETGTEITGEMLGKAGLARGGFSGVKLLSGGELTKSVTITVDKASQAAIHKVEAAGGKVIVSQVDSESAA